jgi:tetratricopeptide (TPR) repeat protein
MTARWPLDVYEMQHVTDEIKEGRLPDYARLAEAYDRGKLDAASMRELPYFLAEAGKPGAAVQAVHDFIHRFGDTQPRLRRLVAECLLRQDKPDLDDVIANYRASIRADTPLVEKLDTYARLIRLNGVERGLPGKAVEAEAEVETAIKSVSLDEEARSAYRRCVIAAGDVQLSQDRRDQALAHYNRAELVLGRYVPAQVRSARIGAFPNSIREYLGAGNTRAALELVDRWEDTFPTDKPQGQTFFWRGKALARGGQAGDAVRPLERAVRLSVGAAFESEARWLLAQSLEKLGKKTEARAELIKLVGTGIDDAYARMARERLRALGSQTTVR